MTSLRPLSQLKKSGRVTYGKSKGIIHPEDCGPYTCVLMQSITRYEIGDLLERLGFTGQGAEVGIFEDGVMIQPTWTTLKFSTQADLFAQVGAKFRQNFASRVGSLEVMIIHTGSDGLNVSKDGFLAIRSGITLSSIPSDWEPGTLLLFELFHLRGSDKRVDLKCWSFVPKEKVTNDGVFGYNLIKKPVDINALRKYLANKFSFRGLVPYHADGGIGMKVSYEIV
ncbi:unnamed protein product [Bathycoccus prasinos]